MKHIGIIGGGIAGLNTALRLLKKGHRVTVYEKLRGGIDKVCGEGILPFGVAQLKRLGIEELVAANSKKFYGLSYCLGNKKLEASFPNSEYGLGVDRGTLDSLLRGVCRAFDGFELVQGRRVLPQEVEASHDQLIGADGVQGKTAMWSGRKPKHSSRVGVRFRISAPAPPKVTVHFFKQGEIYLTPTGVGTLSVAMLLNKDLLGVKGKELQPYCEAFFRNALPSYSHHAIFDFATRGHIATDWRGKTPEVLLLGDALKAFDPICGAGMSFALICGQYASENLDNVAGYYKAIHPTIKALAQYTRLVIFFSGAGWRTRLMFRQLKKSPALFQKMVASHDGKHQFQDLLDWQTAKWVVKI